MDHKTWLWRKKSSEKTIVASDQVNLSLKGNGEETLAIDKTAELESSVKNPNEKLSSAHLHCDAKDDLVIKHVKTAGEGLAGLDKAEVEARSLKQELAEALRQRVAAEERTAHLDAALKECMQQLRFVREEQKQRINNAVMKTSREHGKTQMVLEAKLAETSKRLAEIDVENTRLNKALQSKEKLIEDLSACNTQAEADFNALIARINITEKNSASLKYELHMLEKEVEIRNEEREFNRRSVDASHKQHLESVKKIAKLEKECHRLRLLVQKRLPGPAALAKMKNEVEMLEREPDEMRRKSNPTMGGLMVKDYMQDNSLGSPNKRINYLIEQSCAMEEENKMLKESVSQKNNDLQSSRIMHSPKTSKLSQVEARLGDFSKGQTTVEQARNIPVLQGFSLASINEDIQVSEPEHFRNDKPRGQPSCKSVGGSDISLMDDFIEMEKIAIDSADKSYGISHVFLDGNSTFLGPTETKLGMYHSEATSKELPWVDNHSVDTNKECQSKDVSVGKNPSWLHNVLRIVLEHNRVTLQSPDEILEDIRTALAHINHPVLGEAIVTRKKSSLPSPSESPLITGKDISWRSPNASAVVDSFDPESGKDISSKEIITKQLQSSLNESIGKIIKLLEGINQPSLMDYCSQEILSGYNGSSLPYKNSATPTGYMVRIFQWKSSELNAVIEQFVHACNDLLNGEADLGIFSRELTSALDWTVNHCFSVQDVSSMKDAIKMHFDWDESQHESELGDGMNSSVSEAEKAQPFGIQSSCFPPNSNNRNYLSQMEEIHSNMKEENKGLKDDLTKMESAKKDLEGKFQLATDKIEVLIIQLQESEKAIADLQKELKALKETKAMIEDQNENLKVLNEDLNTQLTVTIVELNEAHQKISSMEVELGDKSNYCLELEATCIELRLQLGSATNKEIPKYDTDHDERQLQTNWKITAASEKLAECQETILNLGKQLKLLASPREAALFDKVISTSPATTTKNTNHRPSLLDQMLAEDEAETDDLKSPKMKEIICTSDTQKYPSNRFDNPNAAHSEPVKPLKHFRSSKETKYETDTAAEGALAMVPSKKCGGGGGLLRKLLMKRKNKGSKKMTPSPWLNNNIL